MERSTTDQAIDFLSRSARPLLVVPAEPSSDAFCSMIALGLALETLKKDVTMVSAAHVPDSLQFLPGTSQVKEFIERTRDLVIDIPTGRVRPVDLHWEHTDGTLHIIVTPEKGKNFGEIAPRVTSGMYPWDLVVTLGAADLGRLGTPFTEHADFFYRTPILNIDHGTANEFFGTVNLVSATAGTVGEVVYDLLDTLGGVNLLTPEVATCLYAAILTGTRSFQSPHTTPRTFTIASTLLDQNADRQTVTRNLFATHTLPELRLLGRTLARLREAPAGVFWSAISQYDFTESQGTPELVPAVLEEIVERAGEVVPIVIVFERTPEMLEALIALGRVSAEDRMALRDRTNGTILGPFVLVNLGKHPIQDAERLLTEMVFPRLPQAARQAVR